MENRGLSDAEAARLLARCGPNEIGTKKKHRLAAIVAEQFRDCMVLVLIAAAVVSALLGEFTEAFTVLAIVLANALLGTVQSWRTEKAVAALARMNAPTARVVRSGEEKTVPAAALVPGDVLVLGAGDRVGADAAVVAGDALAADESMLTGESFPAEKTPGRDSVFMGTMVVRGRGRAVVRAIGAGTEMGRIAGMLDGARTEATPLQQRLKSLGRVLVVCCLAVCAAVSLAGWLRGEDLMTMFLSGVSLAVAAIPEGLPAVVTVSLAMGVTRMSKRSAMIRRMPAVETLGCVEVVCSDKTGTLTENRMTADRFWTPERAADPGARAALLRAGALASSAEARRTGQGIAVSGAPTEAAVVRAAAEAGIFRREEERALRFVREYPFTSERKRMSRVYAGAGGTRSFVKGAPELVLARCARLVRDGEAVPMTDGARRGALKAAAGMAAGGRRVIAVAGAERMAGESEAAAETGLTLYGLIGMADPPRAEAAPAVASAAAAGIRTVMITGDGPETARAVAEKLGICAPGGRVVTGAELDAMSDEALAGAAPEISVFARVAPAHKHRIVRALKARGLVTAMTGDGVNDAPAVREADVGIAMASGTDVTREASDVVLADDNFASIVDAVRQGRMIYDNIRKFLRYMLSSNLGEVLTMFAAMLLSLPLPLLPVHVLLVNLVTDGLPAMALSADPADGNVMRRPPRGRAESVFSGGLGAHILIRGAFIAAGTVGVFAAALREGEAAARTAAFLTLAASQLVFVFECRSEERGIFSRRIFANRWLVLAVAVSAGIMAAAVAVPQLALVFGFAALPGPLLALALGTALGGALLSSAAHLVLRAARRFRRGGGGRAVPEKPGENAPFPPCAAAGNGV